jgi:hypothetical protein
MGRDKLEMLLTYSIMIRAENVCLKRGDPHKAHFFE